MISPKEDATLISQEIISETISSANSAPVLKLDHLPHLDTTHCYLYPNENCRQLIYYFDNDQLKSSAGYLQFFDQKLVLVFPEHSLDYSNVQIEKKLVSNINIFINKQLLFNYEWLPINTFNNLAKCQDMLYKMFHEYLSLSTNYSPYHYTPAGLYDVFETHYNNQEFTLTCIENYTSTCIQIDTKQNTDVLIVQPEKTSVPGLCDGLIHVQIYIGAYLVFCSQRDFQYLNFNNTNYLLNFIFSKLIKF
ncbi:MAG: hypothetical protein WCJ72_01195 [Chryseobacterium sp.]